MTESSRHMPEELNVKTFLEPVLSEHERFGEAHRRIKEAFLSDTPPTMELDLSADFLISKSTLDNYVTLDWQHREDINEFTKSIQDYKEDASRERPLNMIMHAAPGSGKSHFIKCLAEGHDYISAVTFNMTSLHSIEDFMQPLDAVRNLKVVDRLPLLFLDEFDSREQNYALLLPLLWDGELVIGHRVLGVGKVVIVLAGSKSEIRTTIEESKKMERKAETADNKLPDLLSRINGGELTIPEFDEVIGNRDRRVDKVCVTLALLQKRFGSELEYAPWALLRFVFESEFKYGVRSIEHLVDLIPARVDAGAKLELGDLQLPLKSVNELRSKSLAYHLIAKDADSVIDLWQKCESYKGLVRFKKED